MSNVVEIRPPEPESIERSPVTLTGFLWYLQDEKGLALNSRQSYQQDVIQFMEFLEHQCEGRQLLEARHEDMRAYMEHMLKRLEGRSARRKLSVLRHLYAYLLLSKKTVVDPTVRIPPPAKWKRMALYLEASQLAGPEQVGTLQTAAIQAAHSLPLGARDALIVDLGYVSGLRVSELVGLKLEDLKLDHGIALIRGKGDKERQVPIVLEVANAIRTYLAEIRPTFKPGNSRYLFVHEGGKPLTRQRVHQIVRRAGSRLGVRATPHSLRHSCATHMLENGADLVTVRDVLGHASIETTENYTHMSLKHLREVYRNHHPRAKLRKGTQP